ncbi:MAG: 4Fe-4S dicluster domain-containing protein [Christensenellaceae bacterium]|jgi:carbon-monoxide dehydrogenase iron sulfur subunit|nr:4Fe-4S dicluster domain-containing protein [Christensenellaceae bacterium]
MKRIYVDEKWCLGCRLCEYNCAFANATSGRDDMAKALKDREINPRIRIEEGGGISFAVSCRHCDDPFCQKACISGALKFENGQVTIDQEKCVGCYSCIMACPFGAVMPSDGTAVQKCDLCMQNHQGIPACVEGCPNRAIIFEDREAFA